MPYLVESVLAAVRRAGGEVRRVIHPIVVVERADDGELRAVLPDADPVAPPSGAIAESWIHVDLGRRVPAGLEADVTEVLHDVREVVRDAPAMARQARALADRLLADGLLGADRSAGSASVTRADDLANLLRWLADGHFTFLGHRHLVAVGGRLVPEGPGLGVLHRENGVTEALSPEAVDAPPELLVFTRASAKSRVLRPVQPYYLAVRIVDATGKLLGEHRFLGMLTVAALFENVLDIPVVERHVRDAIHRAGFPLASYSGQQMLEVISALPREELFSSTEQQLHDTAVGVLAVAGRRTVRVFLRPDPYRRFVSCLVYVPRDRYTTSSRIAMADVLRRRLLGSSVDFTVRLTESAHALVHFTVHTDPATWPEAVDVDDLQDEVTEAIRTWDDRLLSLPGSGEVADLIPGVPEAYKAGVDPAQALVDLRYIAGLSGPGDFGLRLYAPSGGQEQRFTLYLAGAPATLSAVLPVLHSLGVEVLDERPYEFVRPDGLATAGSTPSDCGVDEATSTEIRRPADRRVPGAVLARRSRRRGGVRRRPTGSARSCCARGWPGVRSRCCVPMPGTPASSATPTGSTTWPTRCWPTLPWPGRCWGCSPRGSTRRSTRGRPEAEDDALATAQELIDAVTGLDADRILRGFLGMIGATLRTNFYRERPFLSFKIDPSAVPDMPAPRPRFEIFVYSPRVEGVHLRYGPVARGGLRWSDRPEDFRTEILGLVKAQTVKNAVIVPGRGQGRVRGDAGPRRAGDEVVACYRTFISRAARRHRQPRHRARRARRDRPATRRRAPRRRRPLPRRRGGQGHRHVLRHRERDRRRPTGSGSATRSPRAARRATTTRRWASRPAARGRACGGTSASWAWTPRPRSSPSSGSATCRATCSATACCSRRTSGWSPRSTTGTSSSTRHRMPRAGSPSGSGCSRCLARRGTTTTATRSARAVGCGRGRRSRCRVGPEIRAALGIDDGAEVGDPAQPAGADPRDPAGAGRPAVERWDRHVRQGERRRPTPTSATRPTTRSAPMRASCASGSSARAATSG